MEANTLPNGQLALHLADRALAPIYSSTSLDTFESDRPAVQRQAQALSSLTNTAVLAYDTALRLGFGIPLRIMIETHSEGPLVLHSYLNPPSPSHSRNTSREDDRDGDERDSTIRSSTREAFTSIRSRMESREELMSGTPSEDRDSKSEKMISPPPLLIASVIASSSTEMPAATSASSQLSRAGREFQKLWVRDQEEQAVTTTLPGEDS